MSNRFYFGGSDSGSENGEENEDFDPLSGLPFPKPLNRAVFHTDDFEPAKFLSSLSDRFQTLEDLQAELRGLSQTMNKELIDLVNDNYHDFLSLGLTLSGGEEKIEDVRLGLLSFQRDILLVREKVDQRRGEIETYLSQGRQIKKDIAVGRSLLDIAHHLEVLEQKLNLDLPNKTSLEDKHRIESNGRQWTNGWNGTSETFESEDDDDGNGEMDTRTTAKQLQRRADELVLLKFLTRRPAAVQHPFVLMIRPRMRRVQEKIITELDHAISHASDAATKEKFSRLRNSMEVGE